MLRSEPQPSYKLFAADRGWRILGHMRQSMLPRSKDAAQWWYRRADAAKTQVSSTGGIVSKYFMGSAVVGYSLAGFAQMWISPIVVVIFMALFTLLVGAWLILCLGAIIVLRSAVAIRNRFHGVTDAVCPYCHNDMDRPAYACPGCFTTHTNLNPNIYGVFHHACANCNVENLPTLDYLGRSKLTKECPHCHRELHSDTGSKASIHIPVIGGASAGKSILIVTALNELRKRLERDNGGSIEFGDLKEKMAFDKQVQNIEAGFKHPKTSEERVRAFTVTVRPKANQGGSVLYMYDAKGEIFDDYGTISQQSYFRYTSGAIVVIDPFSIPGYVRSLGADSSTITSEVAASTADPIQTYQRFRDRMQEVHAPKGKIKQPLAIVLTKTDALDLERRIGAAGISDVRRRIAYITNDADAIDMLVREFLIANGAGSIAIQADHDFENVRFFSVSSLGNAATATSANVQLQSRRSAEPLVWILNQLDKF